MRSKVRIYVDHSGRKASADVHIPAMELHELMPPGLIRHGGAGSGHVCLMMFFHSPAGSLSPVGKEWLPAGGRFIVWAREALHLYGHRNRKWEHSWLQVAGQWIDGVLRRTTVPLGTPIDLGDDRLPRQYLRLISDELRGRVRQDPDMLQALLQIFWREIERHVSAGGTGRPDSRLDQARRYIEAQFDRPFRLIDAARQAHLSPSYFCSAFARQFGVPPREYAMRLRLQRGAQLLANRDLAIYQVAEMVGCPDALYFSRLFHKRYGVAPTEFRRRQLSS